MLMNNPSVRKCGVDVACTVRVVSDRPARAAVPQYGLGDMLAREQIVEQLSIHVGTGRVPGSSRRQAIPAADLADMIAREALRNELLGY